MQHTEQAYQPKQADDVDDLIDHRTVAVPCPMERIDIPIRMVIPQHAIAMKLAVADVTGHSRANAFHCELPS